MHSKTATILANDLEYEVHIFISLKKKKLFKSAMTNKNNKKSKTTKNLATKQSKHQIGRVHFFIRIISVR